MGVDEPRHRQPALAVEDHLGVGVGVALLGGPDRGYLPVRDEYRPALEQPVPVVDGQHRRVVDDDVGHPWSLVRRSGRGP